MVNVAPDPDELCNRTITVYGKGGKIPNGGTVENPLELFVGNAGTAARFLAAMVCLGNGVYRLHGVPRMHERPQAALFKALRELGYRVDSENGNDKLPVRIFGSSRRESAQTSKSEMSQSRLTSAATVSIEESSQFASALLLCAKVGGWKVEVVGENAEESPYVVMTAKMIEAFPHHGGKFQIEPDASSGSYFWAAGRLVSQEVQEDATHAGVVIRSTTFNKVRVNHWPNSGWQFDEKFGSVIRHIQPLHFGLERITSPLVAKQPIEILKHFSVAQKFAAISRNRDLGDSVMTAITIAPFTLEPIRFTDLGRLRVQECERVVALRTGLTKCGAKVVEEGDTLTVYPSKLHGAEIETYNDHRMAMCFAILGLKVSGIKIKNPACVKKTFPNFFQKLAAPPPNGLGATILDAKTGRKLKEEELFAE